MDSSDKDVLLSKTKKELVSIILSQRRTIYKQSDINSRLAGLFNSNLKRIDGVVKQLVFIRDYPYSLSLSKGTFSRKK